MSSYLKSLVARARGATPAIRPVRQLRFPVEALADVQPVVAPAPTRRMPPPPERIAAPARVAAPRNHAPTEARRRDDIAPEITHVASPPPADVAPASPAAAAPAIQPHLPATRTDAPAARPSASSPDVGHFLHWLESDAVPREQAPESGDRITVVTREAHPQSTLRAEAPAFAGAPHQSDTHIHIGRVELISVAPPPPRATGGTAKPAMSLEDYLRRRDGRA